jgi:hypothetical protein
MKIRIVQGSTVGSRENCAQVHLSTTVRYNIIIIIQWFPTVHARIGENNLLPRSPGGLETLPIPGRQHETFNSMLTDLHGPVLPGVRTCSF